MVLRLCRSLLYVPVSSETMLRKAGRRGADVLILDLEDGVMPDAKATARAALPGYLAEIDFGGAEVLVRVNAPGSAWHEDDIAALAPLGLAGVVLPKVESGEAVQAADHRLGGATPLFVMIETVAGVMAAERLAASSPRVAGLVFGAADYRNSLRAGRFEDETELLFARNRIVHAARLTGGLAFDTPWFDLADEPGLVASAARARRLGFDGKTAIHPGQLQSIHSAFTPSAGEIARARAVIEALGAAAREGRAVALVSGEMVEGLHGTEAQRILALAEAVARRGSTRPPASDRLV